MNPNQSLLLKQTLDGLGVENLRVTSPGIGHNLHMDEATAVYSQIQNWFSNRGALAPLSSPSPDRPHGIYVLDSAQGTPYSGGTLRDANIRNYSWIRGYALRVPWATLETAQDTFDFTIIDNILAKLPAGQKLSLILVPFDPSYVSTHFGATTWTDLDQQGNPITRAVPWDPYLRERRRAFLHGLASHQTSGTALRDNPAMDVINPYLPGGFTGIRDPNTSSLATLPGYSRSQLVAAVEDELRTLTTEFPQQYVQLGFWKITDTNHSPEAWTEIRDILLAEFNGVAWPKVGFFMENLAASRPAGGGNPITGYPNTTFAEPMFSAQSSTWNAFQALTSWKAPFTGPEKVANATPADGIQYGVSSFGAKYFELYVSDIDHAPYQAALQTAAQSLGPPVASVAQWARY